jgi:hypothetical protein
MKALVTGTTAASAPSSRREALSRRKVESLLTFFQTQQDRRWFTDDLFIGLLPLRRMESNSPDGYAEGFVL